MPVRIQVNEYYIQLLADSRDQSFIQLLTALKGIEKMRTRDTYRCSLRKLPEVLKILRGIESVDQLPEGKVKQLYTEEMQRRAYTEEIKRGHINNAGYCNSR